MKRPYQFKARCLVCDHVGTVLHDSKEDYLEVSVCPKCKGAYVDTWKINKYFTGDKPSVTNQPDIPVTERNSKEETIVDKLEKVFDIAVDTYVRTKGASGDIKAIESLGMAISNQRKNFVVDVEKSRKYINQIVEENVKKQLANTHRPGIVEGP